MISDPTKIHRIALELITNALKFTSKGSVKLQVQLAEKKRNKVMVKIIVEDTSIGISLEEQKAIFLQFKKITPSHRGIYKGTGLGLALIKEFINELEGEIYVESMEGKGCKFICSLPLKKPLIEDDFEVEETISVDSQPSIELSGSQGILSNNIQPDPIEDQNSLSKILVVEDEPLAARVIQNTLKNLKCKVTLAINGNMAIELFQNNNYDLIFMDIGLPDINECEVTHKIRLLELNKEMSIPIIALSAHMDVENKQNCINAGINTMLSKPLNATKSKDILNEFIACRKQLNEL